MRAAAALASAMLDSTFRREFIVPAVSRALSRRPEAISTVYGGEDRRHRDAAPITEELPLGAIRVRHSQVRMRTPKL